MGVTGGDCSIVTPEKSPLRQKVIMMHLQFIYFEVRSGRSSLEDLDVFDEGFDALALVTRIEGDDVFSHALPKQPLPIFLRDVSISLKVAAPDRFDLSFCHTLFPFSRSIACIAYSQI